MYIYTSPLSISTLFRLVEAIFGISKNGHDFTVLCFSYPFLFAVILTWLTCPPGTDGKKTHGIQDLFLKRKEREREGQKITNSLCL